MATRAGYFRGGEPEKKIKPPVPLRYRVSPVFKLLDDLDVLEVDLDRAWYSGQMEEQEYFELTAALEKKREAAHKRREATIAGSKYDPIELNLEEVEDDCGGSESVAPHREPEEYPWPMMLLVVAVVIGVAINLFWFGG